MKMFFTFASVAVLAVTLIPCEGRVRRQIWPAPGNPNFMWQGNGFRNNEDNIRNQGFWLGPPRFDRPPRNQNDFRDDFNFGGNRNNGNQNRRRRTTTTTTTTESMGPITSTPRTLHYAPQGCNCLLTQQFNPVCGTDGNTYRNLGLLNCYRRCGTNVSQKRLGTC